MVILFWLIKVTAQGLGAFDSEKESVGVKVNIFQMG